MELHLIVKRMATTLTSETAVRMNVRQLIALAVFIAANTTVIALWFDRRMSAVEHGSERQGDRITIVEKAYESLASDVSVQIDKQNAKLDRLTDAINSLAVNVAKFSATRTSP